nr:MAG TPA: hypothetical protein [Caudoviricetes sp.]
MLICIKNLLYIGYFLQNLCSELYLFKYNGKIWLYIRGL